MSGVLKVIGLASVVSIASFVFATNSRVLAASSITNTGSNITTSPVSVDLAANPGSSTTTTLQVQNNGLKPVGISVKLNEFRAQGNSGQAQIYIPVPSDPAPSWVHFSQTTFTAEPGIWVPVTMTIALPKTAAFGYYYAVLFQPATSVANQARTNTVKGANAVLVLLDAHSANEQRTLSVRSFTASQHVYQYLPASFSIDVYNNGNIFDEPEGNVYISRTAHGLPIASLDINSGVGNVLPGTDRLFKVSWNDGFPVYQVKKLNGQVVSDKAGKPIQQLQWNFSNLSKFRFGRYYAHLVLVYNNGSRDIPVNAEVSFWVIPWIILLVLIIIGLMVTLGLWTLFRVFYRRGKAFKNRGRAKT